MARNEVTVQVKIEPKYSLGFREIDDFEDEAVVKKFLHKHARVVIADNSNILLIIEDTAKGKSINLLDRIAVILHDVQKKDFRIFGRKQVITKHDADKLAGILLKQANSLNSMAATYKIIATALLASKDNFVDIAKVNDKRLSDIIDNPFD